MDELRNSYRKPPRARVAPWSWLIGLAIVLLVAATGYHMGMRMYASSLARKHGGAYANAGPTQVVITSKADADKLIPYLPYLGEFRSIALTGFRPDESQLQTIGTLGNLTLLRLQDCQLTDNDLQYLANLHALSELHLPRNPIKGQGLHHLSQLTKLNILELGATDISGPGLEHLASLPALYELRLHATPIDDAGMDYLAKLKQLRSIDLGLTKITETGFLKLADCIWLGHVQFPDDMVGPDDDIKARRIAKRDAMIRFREARLKALKAARDAGLPAPADSQVPFSRVRPDSNE
jgi:hypothetical protein